MQQNGKQAGIQTNELSNQTRDRRQLSLYFIQRVGLVVADHPLRHQFACQQKSCTEIVSVANPTFLLHRSSFSCRTHQRFFSTTTHGTEICGPIAERATANDSGDARALEHIHTHYNTFCAFALSSVPNTRASTASFGGKHVAANKLLVPDFPLSDSPSALSFPFPFPLS